MTIMLTFVWEPATLLAFVWDDFVAGEVVEPPDGAPQLDFSVAENSGYLGGI